MFLHHCDSMRTVRGSDIIAPESSHSKPKFERTSYTRFGSMTRCQSKVIYPSRTNEIVANGTTNEDISCIRANDGITSIYTLCEPI